MFLVRKGTDQSQQVVREILSLNISAQFPSTFEKIQFYAETHFSSTRVEENSFQLLHFFFSLVSLSDFPMSLKMRQIYANGHPSVSPLFGFLFIFH